MPGGGGGGGGDQGGTGLGLGGVVHPTGVRAGVRVRAWWGGAANRGVNVGVNTAHTGWQ